MYTHVPKDGKTPVYDSASKNWTYSDAPTAQQMQQSASRLIEVDAKAITASSNALEAKDAALQAQETADNKVTADEAVEKVKQSLFFITRREAAGVIGGNQLRLELFEDDAENWAFRVHAIRGASLGDQTVYTLPLNYITRDEYVDLLMRLVTIEQRLGIS